MTKLSFDSFLPPEELDPNRVHYAAMYFPRTRLETALVKLARAVDRLCDEVIVVGGAEATIAAGKVIEGYAAILTTIGCGRRFRAGVLQEWLDWQAGRIGWCRSCPGLASDCDRHQAA